MTKIPDEELRGAFKQAFSTPEAERSVLLSMEQKGRSVPRVLLRDLDQETRVLKPRGGREGRYQVVGEIARGGVGVILKGRDIDLGRDVAMKLLLDEHRDNDEVLQRFVEEAQIGGQLQHPGIVPIYEMGLNEAKRPYFTMKLVKGKTLAARLRDEQRSAREVRRNLAIFERICDAVSYAHSRGVVHRDLKPANIIIGSFAEVQVVDWGFAKVLGHEDKSAARRAVDHTIVSTVRTEGGSDSVAGSVYGTPAYMPPEQALGQIDDLDERSDVFALGAILCEIVTGEAPYVGNTLVEILRKAQRCDLENVRTRLGDHALAPLVLECLSAAQSERPANAGELVARVRAHMAGLEERARTARIAAAERRAQAAVERRTKRLTTAIVATVLGALLLGGSALAWNAKRTRVQAAEAAKRIRAEVDRATLARGRQEWVEAASAAQQAKTLAEVQGADAQLRKEVQQLVAAVQEERDAAARQAAAREEERAFLERADEIRLRGTDSHYEPHVQDDAYGTWLAGFDSFEGRPAAFLRAVAERIDGFASNRQRYLRDRDATSLFELAQRLDPGPWRDRYRDAVVAKDLDALEELAQEALADGAEDRFAPLHVAAATLRHGGRLRTALSIFEAQNERRPDDLWTHFWLSDLLIELGDREGTSRHLAATLALRPESVRVRSRMAHQERDADRTIQVLEDALEMKPDWALGWAYIAVARQRKGNDAGATEAVAKALRMAPDDDGIHSAHASLLQSQGKYEEGLIARARAQELNPTLASHMVSLAYAHSGLGHAEDALVWARRAVRERPGYASAWTCLGATLQKAGASEEAAEAFRRVLEILPTYTYAHFQLAKLAPDDQKHVALDAALKAFPNSARLHYVLGANRTNARNMAGAVEAFERAIAIDPKVGPRAYRYLSWRKTPTDAMALLRKGITHLPDEQELWYALGERLIETKRLAEGIEAYKEAVRLSPEYSAAHIRLLDVLPLTAARAILDAAMQKRRDSASLHYVLGLHMDRSKDEAGAAKAYERAVRLYPEFTRAHIRLLDVLPLTDARDILDAAMQEHPDSASLHYVRGLHLARSKDEDGAAKAFRRAFELDPEKCAWAIRDLSHLLADDQAAIDVLEAATEALPRTASGLCMVWWSLGIHRNSAGKQAEAISAYGEALELAPTESGRLYTELAALLTDDDEAIALLQRGRKLLPPDEDDFYKVYLSLGARLKKAGKQAEAKSIYREALDSAPTVSGRFYSRLAALLSDDAEAIEILQKGCNVLPPHVEYLYGVYWHLGGRLARTGKQDEAISAYREALKLAPTVSVGLYTQLADLLPDDAEAIEVLQEGRNVLPPDKRDLYEVYLRLGERLTKAGKQDDAILAYREAVRLAPTVSAHLYTQLAELLTDDDEAIALLQEGRDALPRDHPYLYWVYWNLGLRLKDAGRTAEAIVAIQETRRLRPGDTGTYWYLGEMLPREEAIVVLREGVKAFRSSNPDGLPLYLGWRLREGDDRQAAEEVYREAAGDPTFGTPWDRWRLAEACYAVGAQDLTKQIYEALLRIEPKTASDHAVISFLRSSCALAAFRDPAEAVRHGRRAVELEDSANHRSILGYALHRAGKLDEAAKQLEPELENKEAMSVRIYLSMVRAAQGNKPAARKLLEDVKARWAATHLNEHQVRLLAEAEALIR